jgi:hypothetical protein
MARIKIFVFVFCLWAFAAVFLLPLNHKRSKILKEWPSTNFYGHLFKSGCFCGLIMPALKKASRLISCQSFVCIQNNPSVSERPDGV